MTISETVKGRSALLASQIVDHREVLLMIAARYAGRATTAEDILQEAFIAAHRNIENTHTAQLTARWFAGVVRNVGRQHKRKSTRRKALLRTHSASLEVPAFGVRGDPELPAWPKKAIACLPARQQEVVSLMRTGKSDKEIAATLGIGQAAVRQHRRRAILKLRKLTGQDIPQDQ